MASQEGRSQQRVSGVVPLLLYSVGGGRMASGALRVPGPAGGAAEANPDRIGPGQLVDGVQAACRLDNPSQSPTSSLCLQRDLRQLP